MSKINVLILLSCVILVMACGGVVSQAPTPDVAQTLDAVRTEAVLTELANQAMSTTQTAALAPSDTPQPTETSTASPTATDTVTITPTFTITATHTPLPTLTGTPTRTPVSGTGPSLTILAVEKNQRVSVRANNLPASQTFTIRIGPYAEYSKNNRVTGTIYSGSGGSLIFTTDIPGDYKDVDRLTIRIDSNYGYYAFNTFTNVNSGTISLTGTPIASTQCEVSTSPSPYTVFPVKANFDAVWTVKNTSGRAWDKAAVDYKYASGTEMQKYGKLFDFPDTINPGGTIKIVVDMIAPEAAGTYATNWVIVEGSTVLCNLPITIVVK